MLVFLTWPHHATAVSLHVQSRGISWGKEYANIHLIGSYSFLCSHSTEKAELLIEKQRN